MKIINSFFLFTIFLFFTNALVEPQPEYAKVLDTWSEGDIQQFLKDRNINYEVAAATPTEGNGKLSIDQLKALAAAELGKLYDASNKYESLVYDEATSFKDNVVDLKETVLSYVWPKHISERVSRSYAYLSEPASSKAKTVSEWVFESWSVAQLQKTLKENKIKYKANAKKSDLIKLAKKNFDKISSDSKSSGSYPGDWLFTGWSTLDLNKWLHDHNVATTKRLSDDRDYLLKTVRSNLYPASLSLKETKDELIESLDVSDASDSGLKDKLANKWSESQLQTWLTQHGVEVSDKIKHDKNSLVALVEENRDSLKSDIESWIEYAKQKTTHATDAVGGAIHEKKKDVNNAISERKKDADNVINDTFMIDVEKWPKDRLTSFLTSRGISIPLFATRKDLIKLVKKYKSRKLVDLSKLKPDVLFEGWSTDQIKGWLQSNKIEASGYRDDLVKKASELYNHLQKENFYKEQAIDLANTAKDTAVVYGTKGKNIAEKVYDDYKEPVGEFLGTAKNKAYDAAVSTKDYGLSFYDYLSSWSRNDLQEYLKSFGVKNTEDLNDEDLVARAKKYTLDYINGDGGWLEKPSEQKPSVFSTIYWKRVWANLY